MSREIHPGPPGVVLAARADPPAAWDEFLAKLGVPEAQLKKSITRLRAESDAGLIDDEDESMTNATNISFTITTALKVATPTYRVTVIMPITATPSPPPRRRARPATPPGDTQHVVTRSTYRHATALSNSDTCETLPHMWVYSDRLV